MRRVLVLFLCAVACRSEDPRVVKAARDRTAVDEVAQEVRNAPRVVVTGRWDHPQLLQRLVNAGLAPRPDDSLPAHPDYRVKPVGYRLGKAHLLAWIYSDSMARRTMSGTIDTVAAIPGGQATAWAEPPMFVMHNNLIAVVIGGSDRQRERIRLAIEAGLRAPSR